jgi:hypothetical protein
LFCSTQRATEAVRCRDLGTSCRAPIWDFNDSARRARVAIHAMRRSTAQRREKAS